MLPSCFSVPVKPASKVEVMQVGSKSVPLLLVHHPRARRYLLRLLPDGTARVTIPRRGSILAAKDFASRNFGWLEKQLDQLAAKPKVTAQWFLGTEIFFRGERIALQVHEGAIRLGTETLKVLDLAGDLKPPVQKHLHQFAKRTLVQRVRELAAFHDIAVSRISVRNQKSRWGSCSRKGTISLNWRLVQTPDHVRDYIILHELAHRRQMNHSAQFWLEVGRLCPDYLKAEHWLKANQIVLE